MSEYPIRVSFLLVSGFMMAAFVLAADALRLANWRDGRRLFQWDVRTPDVKGALLLHVKKRSSLRKRGSLYPACAAVLAIGPSRHKRNRRSPAFP